MQNFFKTIDFLQTYTILSKNYWFFTKMSFFDESFYFWPKYRFFCRKFLFLLKNSMLDQKKSVFDQHFNLCSKFRFLSNIYIFFKTFDFYQNFDCWPKFLFLTRVFIFDQKNNFFWSKFWSVVKIQFLTHIWNFVKTFDFWQTYVTKILIFDKNIKLWQTLQLLTKIYNYISTFDQNWRLYKLWISGISKAQFLKWKFRRKNITIILSINTKNTKK